MTMLADDSSNISESLAPSLREREREIGSISISNLNKNNDIITRDETGINLFATQQCVCQYQLEMEQTADQTARQTQQMIG